MCSFTDHRTHKASIREFSIFNKTIETKGNPKWSQLKWFALFLTFLFLDICSFYQEPVLSVQPGTLFTFTWKYDLRSLAASCKFSSQKDTILCIPSVIKCTADSCLPSMANAQIHVSNSFRQEGRVHSLSTYQASQIRCPLAVSSVPASWQTFFKKKADTLQCNH